MYSLIGSWVNCVLLTTEVLIAWIYISKYYGQLRRPTKLAIFATLCNDIALSIVVLITVYMVCCSSVAKMRYLIRLLEPCSCMFVSGVHVLSHKLMV